MINFHRPVVLKVAIIILTLKCFSIVLAKTKDSQILQSRPVPGSSRPTSEQLANIYKFFKIKNFAAEVIKSTVLLSWNIELDSRTRTKAKENRARPLTISENTKCINNISVSIEDACKINEVQGTACRFNYSKVLNCVNYNFTLGFKNVVNFTTVPVKKNTTTFELTENETKLVKLTWEIECAASYMYPVPVTITNNGSKVILTIEAVCNTTQQICETYLSRTDVGPCIYPTINIHGETVLLSATTFSMENLSINASDMNNIGVEWTMEKMKMICRPVLSSSTSFIYNLVIKDNENNQTVQNVSVPYSCIMDLDNGETSLRQKLTFKNGKITSCPPKTENVAFTIKLDPRPCVSYSVQVFRFENGKPTMQTEEKSFIMIETLESKDIKIVHHVASPSSSRFELRWEIPARCQNVKNFTIPITQNYDPITIHHISLSPNNTKCDDKSCTVNWVYDHNLTSCKEYSIQVNKFNITVVPPLPGTANLIVGSSKSNNTFDGFNVEWNVSKQCLPFLTVHDKSDRSSAFISSVSAKRTENCIDEYCHMRWRFEEKLEPCTTYQLKLGSFTQTITTPPNISEGIANNITIRNEVQQSHDEPAVTPVVRWGSPHCQKTEVLQWKILIRKSRTNAIVVSKQFANFVNSYKFVDVEACETYCFAIQTIFENGNDLYLTEEKHFQADCHVKLLVPISVIAVLLLIAIIIALFLSRKWKKMEAPGKDTEKNINKFSSLESRGRIPSVSHGRLSSFSHDRTSYASRNSRNSSNENAEMDLECLPQMTKRPLNIRDICSFDVGQARMEFFLINKLAEKETKRLPRTIAERPENKMKNRFLNTHPYDFNRVLLSQSENDQNDGYINASFIQGFAEKEKEYIAAQGPKDNTLGDFWQMILEQDVRLIAMVTSLYECGKKKCEKYWPSEDELVIYGDDTQLELLRETTYSFYTIRNILVTKAPDLKREIQQFHFTAWPDFETPDQPEELIRFIEIVRRQARQLNLSSPIVVHCSAGVGRTGTFIALDYLIQQVLITDLVDIPRTVRHLRRFRLSMVQSEAQYVFLYSCIAHYVKTRLSAESG